MSDHIQISRRKGGSPNVADMDVDTAISRRARSLLRAGKLGELESIVQQNTDANDRIHLAEALGDWAGAAPWVEAWREQSSLPFAKTACGIWRVKRAWDSTPWTHGAVNMSEFKTQLEIAKGELLAAAKADVRCPAPIPWLMWCARGQRDNALYQKVLQEGLRRTPEAKFVYSSAIYSESALWFGDDERLMAFARHSCCKAPRGIGAPALLVEAHLFADPAFGQGKGGYWHTPTVRGEVIRAARECEAEGFRGINGIRTRHWLAFGLWKVAEHAAASPHFRELGSVWNQVPWSGTRILNRLLNPYFKARKQCLGAA